MQSSRETGLQINKSQQFHVCKTTQNNIHQQPPPQKSTPNVAHLRFTLLWYTNFISFQANDICFHFDSQYSIILKQSIDTVKVETDWAFIMKRMSLAWKLMQFVYHKRVSMRWATFWNDFCGGGCWCIFCVDLHTWNYWDWLISSPVCLELYICYDVKSWQCVLVLKYL